MPAQITTPPIALLTDFGLADWFVGALHGEILSRIPNAHLIDITHHVPPGNVAAGAFALAAALPSLPEGTIILAVVDPGVGSPRRAMCGRIGKFGFSGPDNGLATPLLASASTFQLNEIEKPPWRKTEASTTFHGRDLFAPAAAQLALGFDATYAGPEIETPITLPPNIPTQLSATQYQGEVLWIDHFGNCITSFDRTAFESVIQPASTLQLGDILVKSLSSTYTDLPAGALLAYWGSAGFLEIACNQASAAKAAHAIIGSKVTLALA